MQDNKKVFITGASGGIGSAICEKFKNKNFTLILTSSSDSKISSLKDKYGKQNYYYKIDLSNSETLQSVLKNISKEHKDISTIVNNAGTTLLPNMLARKKGKIIGISSIVGTTGNPGQSNYVASKSGLIGLYKSIALEVAKRNINVNIISPGFIKTSMTDNLNDDQRDSYLSKIPMMRFGKPEDIANLVYFLSSEESCYITGQNFHVNGGMLMV